MHPTGHVAVECAQSVVVVGNDKALYFQALGQDVAHQYRGEVRAFGQAGEVVPGDDATDGHAGAGIEQRHHRLQHLATDVFEIDVDALRAGFGQSSGEVVTMMVDAGIEAELLHGELALRGAAGNAHHTAALQFRNLPHSGAHRARGRSHHHSFAGFGLAQIEQANIGRQAGHAEHAQGPGSRGQLRV